MRTLLSGRTMTAIALALSTQLLFAAAAKADDDNDGHRQPRHIEHVLLISIDGFHAVDLTNCVAGGYCPHLAELAEHGVTYANASTTKPSDSFPGLTAQITGGTPKSAGVYYDDSYDRTLYAPANFSTGPCTSGPGAETNNSEVEDKDLHQIDGGVPAALTGLNSAVAIDPNNLPGQLVNGVCTPVWPHNFIRVNTIFQIIHQHHMHTAWSDKHPAYDLVNGNDPDSQPTNAPGTNVDDFFAP
ncbi:MAG TPA: alkaline phosphatase family protein, partial [Roseiarcus sp.]|nr:alkaline phosphatase family protein [Roseiarcus sp.]